MHRTLLYNDELRDSSDRFLSPGQVGVLNGWGVFSTLRVSNGVLFAFERHWARMVRDAARMHVPLPASPNELHENLLRLVATNQAPNSTLRVAILRNTGGAFDAPNQTRLFDIIAFTKDLANWGPGARLACKPDARHGANEFAGAKITAWAQNLTWYEQSRQRGYDEVVLLDEHGRVSECTSANLFAIFDDTVFTPPLDAGCLPGITREILLEQIRIPGLTIAERHILPSQLEQADAVFMTSSTRQLHPVLEIEGLQLRNAPSCLPLLQTAFHQQMERYLPWSSTEVLTH